MYEVELKNIDKYTKETVVEYLSLIGHNEAFIVHFLEDADAKPSPIDYIKTKYPDIEF